MITAENLALLLIALKVIQKRKGAQRRRVCHVRDAYRTRALLGEITLVKQIRDSDPYLHHRYFRMKRETFDKILNAIKDEITVAHTHAYWISPLERLAVTLRYLATGNAQISMSMTYRLGASTVSAILRQVMTAICRVLKDKIRVPRANEWAKVESEFKTKWNFPQCVGAIDGKHIRIKKPPCSGSQYFNYKGFYSVVLLAVVDANLRFILFEHGASGSCSDGGVLQKSTIGRKLEEEKYEFPPPVQLSSGHHLKSVIIGDEGFPLKPYLMKPFSSRTMEATEKVFNYRLSRARMTTEDAFGLLAARWRIFHTEIEANLELVSQIIQTCIILHNFLIDEGDYDRAMFANSIANETDSNTLTSIQPSHSNNSTREAIKLRETFRDYFVSPEGEVSWQGSHVTVGYE